MKVKFANKKYSNLKTKNYYLYPRTETMVTAVTATDIPIKAFFTSFTTGVVTLKSGSIRRVFTIMNRNNKSDYIC